MLDKETKEDITYQSAQKDKIRTGTPRKSKAKELLLREEFCVFCYGSPSCSDEDLEELLKCSECLKYAHPSCLEMPGSAIEGSKLYNWQCNDCKGCFQCKKKTKEKCIIICDYCDRGFHTFCLEKKPTQAKITSWRCPFCEGIESNKHIVEAKSDDQGFLKEGFKLLPDLEPDQADDKQMYNSASTPHSVLHLAPECSSIKSEQNPLSLEHVRDSRKKDKTLKSDTEQRESIYNGSCTASTDSALTENGEISTEHSLEVRVSLEEFDQQKLVGKACGKDMPEIEKITGLDKNGDEEPSLKRTKRGRKSLRELCESLSTSTVSISPENGDQQKSNDSGRSLAEYSLENNQNKMGMIVLERMVQRRRSSRLSRLGVGSNIPMKTGKEEEGISKERMPCSDTAKVIECEGASHMRENLKLTGKEHHNVKKNVSGPRKVSENEALKPSDNVDLVVEGKGERRKGEVSSERKCERDGEQRETVPFVHTVKKKRGRPRKYPLLPDMVLYPQSLKEKLSDSEELSVDVTFKNLDKKVDLSEKEKNKQQKHEETVPFVSTIKRKRGRPRKNPVLENKMFYQEKLKDGVSDSEEISDDVALKSYKKIDLAEKEKNTQQKHEADNEMIHDEDEEIIDAVPLVHFVKLKRGNLQRRAFVRAKKLVYPQHYIGDVRSIKYEMLSHGRENLKLTEKDHHDRKAKVSDLEEVTDDVASKSSSTADLTEKEKNEEQKYDGKNEMMCNEDEEKSDTVPLVDLVKRKRSPQKRALLEARKLVCPQNCIDAAKDIDREGTPHGRESFELTAKGRYGTKTKISDTEEVNEDVALNVGDNVALVVEEKSKQRKSEVSSEVKCEADGEKHETVPFVHTLKKKGGRRRKRRLRQARKLVSTQNNLKLTEKSHHDMMENVSDNTGLAAEEEIRKKYEANCEVMFDEDGEKTDTVPLAHFVKLKGRGPRKRPLVQAKRFVYQQNFIDTAKDISCEVTSHGKQSLKLTGKEHCVKKEKVSDPQKVYKDVVLNRHRRGKCRTIPSKRPLKVKRGRPRKKPILQEKSLSDEKCSIHIDHVRHTREKASHAVQNESPSRKRDLRNTPNKDSKDILERSTPKEEEERQRVLRKTSREPAISPTKARSILSGNVTGRATPRKSELEISPVSERVSETVHSKSTPSKAVATTPSKSPVKSLRKSVEKCSPKGAAPLSKEARNVRRSDQKKTDSDLSARKKESKTKVKVSDDSISKRKLSFEQKATDAKKAKTLEDEHQETEGSQRQTRRSMPAKKEEEGTKTQESEIEAIVPLQDRLLFEKVQKTLEESVNKNKPKNMAHGIRLVHFGQYEIDTWYSSPYPSEIRQVGEVFVCEFCLKYMKSATILRRHTEKCPWRHPPGDEIYRKDKLSVFEVDGEISSTYCQNLCLFAKLFLDHKTLYYEVEPFLFYVMTLADCYGCHIVGYFSKEKVSFLNYNVSCILVMPHCMRMGYGKALIEFSYLLSRKEGKVGSPERPLSDLGLISYRSYWKGVLLRHLHSLESGRVSIKELSQKTGIMSNDLISTLQYLGMLKYWKGKHIIIVPQEMRDAHAAKCKANSKLSLIVDESKLIWTPKSYGNNKNKSKVS